MDIKDLLTRNLQINKLTKSSLKEAIINYYSQLFDNKKRYINHEIAYCAIEDLKPRKDKITAGNAKSLSKTNVLAVNHAGPLDVTLVWKTEKNGTLKLLEYHVHSGGDQINVSKVFSSFGENIALVALTGKGSGKITKEWENHFLDDKIIPTFIRESREDQQVAVYNIVDGEHLPAMFGWLDELSQETVENINQKALSVLDEMFKERKDNVWMVFSAGGPIRYNSRLAYYGTLIKQVKEKYKDRVEFLIDFKHVSGPEEAMSVLDISRSVPQDIIKPNLEEFIQILIASGLVKPGVLHENTITEELVKEYATKLRNKYNLLGVLVSMGKSGVILIMQDRIIKEKGIEINLASHVAAGDSLKAGFLYALSKGKSFQEAMHTGNLFGASTASMEGSQTVTPEKLTEIEHLAKEQNITPEVEYLK